MSENGADEPEWLARARALVPEVFEDPALATEALSNELRPRDVLWELLRLVKDRHAADRAGFVDRAFDYASWCSAQEDKELWNPAGIGFFAKVAGEGGVSLRALAEHLTLARLRALEALFDHHYGEDRTAALKQMVQAQADKQGG